MKSALSEKMTPHVKAIGAGNKRETGTRREAIGAVLTELRVEKGWSQRTLAVIFSATVRLTSANWNED